MISSVTHCPFYQIIQLQQGFVMPAKAGIQKTL